MISSTAGVTRNEQVAAGEQGGDDVDQPMDLAALPGHELYVENRTLTF